MSIRRACLFALLCAARATALAFVPPAVQPADTPWRVQQTTRAVYPPRLMRQGVTHGEARIRISIAASGELIDALVVACSHRDFGDEALRTVKQWRYEAARVTGQPMGVVGDVTFAFVINGPVAIEKLSPGANEVQGGAVARLAYQAESLQRLDRIPMPAHIVPPVYPEEWSAHGITGSATIQFYIDETGQARIPLVTASDHPWLGASAAAAVSQWRFEPPTCHGMPVLVRAEQVFTFQPAKK